MSPGKIFRVPGLLAGCTILALAAGVSSGEEQPFPGNEGQQPVGVNPAPAPVANPLPPPKPIFPGVAVPRMDVGKGSIELPTKQLVARAAALPAAVTEKPENPRVEPGRVHWHPNYEAACTAAQKSGKPVLLFHMLGKLDEQFC